MRTLTHTHSCPCTHARTRNERGGEARADPQCTPRAHAPASSQPDAERIECVSLYVASVASHIVCCTWARAAARETGNGNRNGNGWRSCAHVVGEALDVEFGNLADIDEDGRRGRGRVRAEVLDDARRGVRCAHEITARPGPGGPAPARWMHGARTRAHSGAARSTCTRAAPGRTRRISRDSGMRG